MYSGHISILSTHLFYPLFILQLHKILMERKDDDDRRAKNLPIEEGCLAKGSVIVYVWRQRDTEIVAEQLNGAGIRGGVVCYHGGMDAGDRSRAQSKVSH